VIRIAVVDDHPIVRQGLAAALDDEDDFEVVGSAGSAEEAIELVRRVEPDVVLLDLELPGIGGIEAIPRLLAAHAGVRVLVFTAYGAEERVLGALRAGAAGYLLKGAASEDIARSVRTVAAGETVLAPSVASTVVHGLTGTRGTGQLTSREREVLRMIAEGSPNKQIARSLVISERTVKFHVSSLLRKLGAENRAQCVAIAAERGLLDRPGFQSRQR
jgi:DNA-binding NarL/FixJ family response regulator